MYRSGAAVAYNFTMREKITPIKLPGTVLALGLVSFLMDFSSEMIHAVLPVFLVSVLGAGPLIVGVIEGVGEAVALAAKVVSGVLSDRMRRRKPLVLTGYLLAALSKPLFALAGSSATVMTARAADRFGKGIRGAPRDALITDVTPAAARGAAFGLRQSLDTAGAVAGPLFALLLLGFVTSDVRAIFWVATVPAGLCVLLLLFAVKEAPRAIVRDTTLSWRKDLGAGFWAVATIATLLQLARFSEAFLILRAQQLGWSLMMIPVVLITINISYAITAYPAGQLSDRYGRTRLLLPGIVVLILADLVLGFVGNTAGLIVGALLWGAHMGLTAGILAAMVSDTAPESLRGTAFGIYNLLSAVALLAASVLAGGLWQLYSYQATFIAGSLLATLALLSGWWLSRRATFRA